MTRGTWTWLVIVLIVIVGMAIVLFARSDAHYPAGFGFPGDRDSWHQYWIAFWSGTAPNLVVAIVIALGAGVYLSNRDRDLDARDEQRATRQRAREGLALLSHALRGVADKPDYVYARISLDQTIPVAAVEIHRLLLTQPYRLWRDSLPDATDVLAVLDQFEDTYRHFERVAHKLDLLLNGALRLWVQNPSAVPPFPDYLWIREERILKTYCVGRIQGVSLKDVALALNYRDPLGLEMKSLDDMWTSISVQDVFPRLIPECQDARAHLVQAAHLVWTSVQGN